MRRRNGFKPASILITLMLCASPGSFADDDSTLVVAYGTELSDWWLPARKAAPEYPARALAKRTEGCVSVAFVIESDGSTSSHHPLISFPSTIFNRSAVKAARQFRYEPADSETQSPPAVYTFNTFTYQIGPSRKPSEKRRQELLAVCESAAAEAMNDKVTSKPTERLPDAPD
ncbi:energy transducer TonB [Elongatibacter sediminis]|uniref:Protein TonB n=1 Tax=Elongatibacter sediminis TaxID=3119006 RepID=A0AAW9REL7_9GAMM